MSYLSKHFSLSKAKSPLKKNHPGHVYPASIVRTQATEHLSYENGKEKEKFRSTATDQEINKPNNVARQELSYKNGKEKEKFKAVKNGKLLKYKSRNNRRIREVERNISTKAQNRKAKRLLNKKFKKAWE